MKTAPPTALLELQQWPRWVVWRTVERDGKPTKVPFQPNGQPAKSTDPETWSTYEEASKALERGKFDGIGYVFGPNPQTGELEYAGVDLDKCVDDGKVHPEAWKIVERLGSYTELSPTGTGLHVIVRGRINGDRKRTAKTPWGGDFESYDQGRFFTVTGQHRFGTPATIEARQEELDEVRALLFPAVVMPTSNGRAPAGGTPGIDDIALMEKIRASKQGPRFTDLFDRGAPENQESEADLGLCNILAFWLGPDPARIDSWFRRSALMREKWDDRRGETTYGGYTIDRALEGRTEFYDPQRATRPQPRPLDDNVDIAPGEEISQVCGLIDNPFIHGWRTSRKAISRVVLTAADGRILDIDNWKAATGSPKTLAQEIRHQLTIDVTLTKGSVERLDVLVSKFCELVATTTIDQRARELGEEYLQEAESLLVDMSDRASRYAAFTRLRDNDPGSRSKTENVPLERAGMVLVDVTGKRYVRVQWFIDYVRANVVSGTAGAVLEAIERPGWWSRPNTQSKFKATHPSSGPAVFQRLFEVPADWEGAG